MNNRIVVYMFLMRVSQGQSVFFGGVRRNYSLETSKGSSVRCKYSGDNQRVGQKEGREKELY